VKARWFDSNVKNFNIGRFLRTERVRCRCYWCNWNFLNFLFITRLSIVNCIISDHILEKYLRLLGSIFCDKLGRIFLKQTNKIRNLLRALSSLINWKIWPMPKKTYTRNRIYSSHILESRGCFFITVSHSSWARFRFWRYFAYGKVKRSLKKTTNYFQTS